MGDWTPPVSPAKRPGSATFLSGMSPTHRRLRSEYQARLGQSPQAGRKRGPLFAGDGRAAGSEAGERSSRRPPPAVRGGGLNFASPVRPPHQSLARTPGGSQEGMEVASLANAFETEAGKGDVEGGPAGDFVFSSPLPRRRSGLSYGSGALGGAAAASPSPRGLTFLDDFQVLSTPEKSENRVYSDRHIPSRAGSNLEAREPFEVREIRPSQPAEPEAAQQPLPNTGPITNGQQPYLPTGQASDQQREGQAFLNLMLRTELLGEEPSSARRQERSMENTPGTPSSPARSPANMFRYRAPTQRSPWRDVDAEIRRSLTASVSPHAHEGQLSAAQRTAKRRIPKMPFKVLDAPQLADDFYLNLVDWSSQNVMAVGLGSCVYLWSAATGKVTRLCDLGEDDAVTSVAWTQRGTHLAVGTNKGEIHLWEVARCRRTRVLVGHQSRVGSLSWNTHTLASGSRDKMIYLRDVRVAQPYVSQLGGHKAEICGLKWAFDGTQLASGGNDNKLMLWSARSTNPLVTFREHIAAVKALAWSPHQPGLLASGGGTADRHIRFWSTATQTQLSAVDTGSQVCNLMWSTNVNEIVSTHGYSLNQIAVWRYPSMTKIATLTGHSCRVLYLAMSPDGQTIVTGAGDETLRFWTAFPGPKTRDGATASLLFPFGPDIR